MSRPSFQFLRFKPAPMSHKGFEGLVNGVEHQAEKARKARNAPEGGDKTAGQKTHFTEYQGEALPAPQGTGKASKTLNKQVCRQAKHYLKAQLKAGRFDQAAVDRALTGLQAARSLKEFDVVALADHLKGFQDVVVTQDDKHRFKANLATAHCVKKAVTDLETGPGTAGGQRVGVDVSAAPFGPTETKFASDAVEAAKKRADDCGRHFTTALTADTGDNAGQLMGWMDEALQSRPVPPDLKTLSLPSQLLASRYRKLMDLNDRFTRLQAQTAQRSNDPAFKQEMLGLHKELKEAVPAYLKLLVTVGELLTQFPYYGADPKLRKPLLEFGYALVELGSSLTDPASPLMQSYRAAEQAVNPVAQPPAAELPLEDLVKRAEAQMLVAEQAYGEFEKLLLPASGRMDDSSPEQQRVFNDFKAGLISQDATTYLPPAFVRSNLFTDIPENIKRLHAELKQLVGSGQPQKSNAVLDAKIQSLRTELSQWIERHCAQLQAIGALLQQPLRDPELGARFAISREKAGYAMQRLAAQLGDKNGAWQRMVAPAHGVQAATDENDSLLQDLAYLLDTTPQDVRERIASSPRRAAESATAEPSNPQQPSGQPVLNEVAPTVGPGAHRADPLQAVVRATTQAYRQFEERCLKSRLHGRTHHQLDVNQWWKDSLGTDFPDASAQGLFDGLMIEPEELRLAEAHLQALVEMRASTGDAALDEQIRVASQAVQARWARYFDRFNTLGEVLSEFRGFSGDELPRSYRQAAQRAGATILNLGKTLMRPPSSVSQRLDFARQAEAQAEARLANGARAQEPVPVPETVPASSTLFKTEGLSEFDMELLRINRDVGSMPMPAPVQPAKRVPRRTDLPEFAIRKKRQDGRPALGPQATRVNGADSRKPVSGPVRRRAQGNAPAVLRPVAPSRPALTLTKAFQRAFTPSKGTDALDAGQQKLHTWLEGAMKNQFGDLTPTPAQLPEFLGKLHSQIAQRRQDYEQLVAQTDATQQEIRAAGSLLALAIDNYVNHHREVARILFNVQLAFDVPIEWVALMSQAGGAMLRDNDTFSASGSPLMRLRARAMQATSGTVQSTDGQQQRPGSVATSPRGGGDQTSLMSPRSASRSQSQFDLESRFNELEKTQRASPEDAGSAAAVDPDLIQFLNELQGDMDNKVK